MGDIHITGDMDEHLTYIEWFSTFSVPNPDHGMLRLNCMPDHIVSIVPVLSIRHSVHLFPKFGPKVPELSGPLWTDPQSELQVNDSVRFTCPLSRQPANHEDSTAISGLTTNGRRFFDNTHSNPFKGTDCYKEYIRFLRRVM